MYNYNLGYFNVKTAHVTLPPATRLLSVRSDHVSHATRIPDYGDTSRGHVFIPKMTGPLQNCRLQA